VLRARWLLFHKIALSIDGASGAILFVLLLSFFPSLSGPLAPATLPGLFVLGLAATLALPLTLEFLGLYQSQRRQSVSTYLARFTGASLFVTLAMTGLATALRAPVDPIFPMVLVGAQLLVVGALRTATLLALRTLRGTGRNSRYVLIVCTGPRAAGARSVLEQILQWGLQVVGYLDEIDAPIAPGIDPQKVHKLMDLPRLLREKVIDEVVVACPRSMLASLGPVVAVCAESGVPITVLSDLFGDFLPPPQVSRFGGNAALSFATVHHSRLELALKRGIDIAASSLVLTITAPVIALAALAIKRTSPGPVMFRQVRCGLYGRPFEMLKLRTMVQDAEARRAELLELNEMDGPVFKMKYDPRITPVGRLLRRFSIDELPQLWNVLRGDMSLVGPRPPIPSEVNCYATTDRRRLSMRPGITCLWQVSGRNDIGFDQWVKLDLAYIDSWSLGLDLRVLVKTIPAVFKGTGA
jgi:exopolysaccharide biosynthesis polyprenyl glycosylphosphotransferase